MASELLVKRLLKQAGVSVLAGLLLSSAVLAEDNADNAGNSDDGAVSVGIEDGGPDVSIDPVDPGDWGDWGGDDGDLGDGGSDDGSDDGAIDDENSGGGEWTGGEDGAVDEGWTGGETGGGDPIDGCIACSGVPDIAIDPREMDGTFNDEGTVVDDGVTFDGGEFEGVPMDGVALDGEVTTMADGPVRGTEPNHRGNVSLPGDRGQKAEHYQGDGGGKKAVIVPQTRESLR